MAKEDESEKSGAAIWVALVVILVLYVLSPAPMAKLKQAGIIPDNGRSVQIFLYPLGMAYRHWPPAAAFYNWWFRVWDVEH